MDKYQEILEQFRTVNKTFQARKQAMEGEKMNVLLIGIEEVARRNYLRTFAFDTSNPMVNDTIAIDTIVSALKCAAKKSVTVICQPSFHQMISYAIKDLYFKPGEFVPYIYDYFQRNKSEFGVFVNLTFPALYGFFNVQELSIFALDLLSELMDLDDLDFLKHFAISFFSSSVVFADVFWKQFFEMVNAHGQRNRPSIAQLYSYLVKNLKHTVKYMSPHHIQFALSYMTRYPEQFCECFFEGYLLSTFDIWMKCNPGVSSSKVKHEDMQTLLRYVTSEISGSVFQDISQAFTKNSFALFETTSFAPRVQPPVELILLSGYEEVLLSKLFLSVPLTAAKVVSWERLELKGAQAQALKSLDCFIIEIHMTSESLPQPPPSEEPEHILFNFEKKPLVNVTEEHKRMMDTIIEHCNIYGLNPLQVIIQADKKLKTDTFFDKLMKDKVKITTKEFKEYVLSHFYNENVRAEDVFEDFFMRLQTAQQLEDIKQHLVHYGQIVEQHLAEKLRGVTDGSVFPKTSIKEELNALDGTEGTEEFISLKPLRGAFQEALEDYSCDDPEYQDFTTRMRELLTPLHYSMSRLDELPIGDHLFIICDVFNSLDSLCQQQVEWVRALLWTVFARARCLCLFTSLLKIFRFKNTHESEVSRLSQETQYAWNLIHAFFIDLISSSDKFDEKQRLAIQSYVPLPSHSKQTLRPSYMSIP